MSEAKPIDDGGPAFPSSVAATTNANGEQAVIDSADRCLGGMSLRDYFAGQALTGIITRQVQVETRGGGESVEDFHKRCNETLQAVANRNIAVAFQYANAMVAARKAVAL